MPTLNKEVISTAPKRQRKEGKSGEIYKLYNSKRWREMRHYYLMLHPFCEECEKLANNGSITAPKAATEVHHVTPISTGQDMQEMAALAYNYNNLIALCQEHHVEAHRQLGKWNKEKH
jgi:5-methylcytosine-specific restriction protein A